MISHTICKSSALREILRGRDEICLDLYPEDPTSGLRGHHPTRTADAAADVEDTAATRKSERSRTCARRINAEIVILIEMPECGELFETHGIAIGDALTTECVVDALHALGGGRVRVCVGRRGGGGGSYKREKVSSRSGIVIVLTIVRPLSLSIYQPPSAGGRVCVQCQLGQQKERAWSGQVGRRHKLLEDCLQSGTCAVEEMPAPLPTVSVGVCAVTVHHALMPAPNVLRAVWPLVRALAVVLAADKAPSVARAGRVRECALATQDILRSTAPRVPGRLVADVSERTEYREDASMCVRVYVRVHAGFQRKRTCSHSPSYE